MSGVAGGVGDKEASHRLRGQQQLGRHAGGPARSGRRPARKAGRDMHPGMQRCGGHPRSAVDPLLLAQAVLCQLRPLLLCLHHPSQLQWPGQAGGRQRVQSRRLERWAMLTEQGRGMLPWMPANQAHSLAGAPAGRRLGRQAQAGAAHRLHAHAGEDIVQVPARASPPVLFVVAPAGRQAGRRRDSGASG